VINVARLVPEKAQHVLLRAARTVAEARPDVRFVFAGEGPLKESLQALTGELGLLSQVQFLDFRDDIDRLLAASDVFVLSSVFEGMPVSLLEAMSAGCPSVATRVGGIPQVLRDGETGLLVPPDEPAALAEALLALLNNPERGMAMGDAARQTAVREYDNRAWARKLENLYLNELRRASPKRRGSTPHRVRP
jgi:glycosyltransferase involved in cell wall biosynthesis